ncbi:hypothetical protein EDB81DRAFT_12164 [Dactylonectria macrodidyma]|uniref:Uncharacterized protein n=1 Tax=Dactylonectria macrodidyma TaxID=307937 RepID=A0A9P9JIH6_9HYPO|nr:hypothetical protein EDB81DRAFT_12164 [Dactylonectria macrodidyma]
MPKDAISPRFRVIDCGELYMVHFPDSSSQESSELTDAPLNRSTQFDTIQRKPPKQLHYISVESFTSHSSRKVGGNLFSLLITCSLFVNPPLVISAIIHVIACFLTSVPMCGMAFKVIFPSVAIKNTFIHLSAPD